MYDFLAPWGVLVPALSGICVYVLVAKYRRKKLIQNFKVPGAA